MKNPFSPLILLCITSVISVGCTHRFTPDIDTFRFDDIEEFRVDSTIRLINDQPFTDDVTLASYGHHEYVADLNEWTAKAVALATRELSARGATIAPDADIVLKLSITHAETEAGFVQTFCSTTLRVKTGDGYVHEYDANAGSPAHLSRAVDGAVTRVVAAMLRDQKIIRYLQGQ